MGQSHLEYFGGFCTVIQHLPVGEGYILQTASNYHEPFRFSKGPAQRQCDPTPLAGHSGRRACASLCGADNSVDVETWGQTKDMITLRPSRKTMVGLSFTSVGRSPIQSFLIVSDGVKLVPDCNRSR